MTENDPRVLSYEILYEVLEKDGYLHRVLPAVLQAHQYLEKRQRAFVTRVVQGTIERLITIDAVIDRFAAKPKVAGMKPVIRTILRESVYQILYMDGVRDAAVCNEAVKLAKKRGFTGLAGFVNGVLRHISREKENLAFQSQSERYAAPQWLIDMWLRERGGAETDAMLEALLAQKATCVRVNLRRIAREELALRLRSQGIKAKEAEDLPSVLYLSDYDHLLAVPEFREGLFYVQDKSSVIAMQHAGVRPGDHVIDVCAAPGGKSLCALELMEGKGTIEARDLSEAKVALLKENIARTAGWAKDANILVQQRDASVLWEDSVGQADVVLCDLPCSGLGVIAKKPDIKLRMTPEKIVELARLQQQILNVVCAYVREGGILFYSTCTISRAENEDNVRAFLERRPEFVLEGQEQILPEAGKQDGFFYARMRKK